MQQNYHQKTSSLSQKNLYFALPVIILSTITGTANFAQSSFPAAIQPYAPSMIGTLNLVAGLITTVSQFLRVSELLESHRVASLAFGKLSRNIAVELSLPIKERTTDGTAFLSACRVELDKLIEQSPSVPLSILSKFDKKFENHDFIKPDILEITSVEVYQNNELEDKKIKDALLKAEKEKRDAIIKEEEDRKLKAYNEIKKLKKQTKKKVVSTMSVHKSLDKLLSNLNPAENQNNEVQLDIFDNTTSSDSSLVETDDSNSPKEVEINNDQDKEDEKVEEHDKEDTSLEVKEDDSEDDDKKE